LISLEKFTTEDPTCISLYVPPGKPLTEIIAQLKMEMGTATNIKKDSARTDVLDTLSRVIVFIKEQLETLTPENGFVLFCAPDYPIHFIDPTKPVQVNLYRCDTKFALNYLADVM